MQRLVKILAQKAAQKKARMAKLLQFLQGQPKPAFPEKVQRGTKETFSNIAQKVAIVWEALFGAAFWAKIFSSLCTLSAY